MARNKRTLDVRAELQPFLDAFGEALADVVSEHIAALLERARSYAIERVQVELAGVPNKPSKPTKSTTTKSGKTCKVCKEPGHNARTCPRAQSRAKVVEAPSAVVEPPSTSRPDRFAEIESRAAARRTHSSNGVSS